MKINEVQAADLNGTCLTLISQFSRVLKAHNGVVLRLTDSDVVEAVVRHARSTSNQELQRICHMLIVEIKAHMSKDKGASSQFSVYQNIDSAASDKSPHKRNRRL